jgi:hypothetical protein
VEREGIGILSLHLSGGKKLGRHPLISQRDFLQWMQLLNWVEREQLVRLITGEDKRCKRIEVLLPRLEKKRKLIARWYRGNKVYTVPRKSKNKLYYHGIGVSECLIRFWLSKRNGLIVQEHKFKGCGVIPDGGIKFKNSVLLYEFSTESNYDHGGLIKGKITRYKNNLFNIERKFKAPAVVIFVLDVKRSLVQGFIERHYPTGEPFYFTDYDTFKSVSVGKQLSEPIYIWQDGKEYPLIHA